LPYTTIAGFFYEETVLVTAITCEVHNARVEFGTAMPAKKMRVEVFDEEGNRYSITLEGEVTKRKALCLLDIVELLGTVHSDEPIRGSRVNLSKYDKVRAVIESGFRLRWFSSRDIVLAYEQEFQEPVPLSTVSTYLARMVDRGVLMKEGTVHNLKYRMMPDLTQTRPKMVGNR
jgi:hypothetical protein